MFTVCRAFSNFTI